MMAAVATALTLGELLGAAAGAHRAVEISDLTLDSREARPGAAFFAVAGTRDHGLSYAADALSRGAEIVLYDPDGGAVPAGAGDGMLAVPKLADRLGQIARRFYWHDRAQPALYGVTGTNGKTTVAWLVAQALAAHGRDAAYIGTLGFGRPDSLHSHRLTTPDCLSLHRELASLDVAAAAIEVSSHGLQQNRLAGLELEVAAVTNLSRDHLDAHGSMRDYAATKARILDLPGLAVVVLNRDDAFADGLAPRVPSGVKTLGVSQRVATDLAAAVVDHGLDGIELTLRHGAREARVRSALVGDFNAENLLVAAGMLIGAGLDLADAGEALTACRAAPGRLEVFRRADGATAVVDFAHTPAALTRVIAVLERLCTGELVCVFGCGGDRDRGKRALMGRAAANATRVVLTDDNPRSEDPAAIVAGIREGLRSDQPVVIEHDRARAIRAAIATAGPADIVLVAGKGHETTQSIGGARRPFDDREIVRAALADTGAAS